jgi:tetratricopeptide (TPR) repeat protein
VATAKYLGVYSSLSTTLQQKSGTAARKICWFAWDDLAGGYIVQKLNAAYKPIDEPSPVSAREFSQCFKLEQSVYVTPLTRLEVADRPEKQSVSLDLPDEIAGPGGRVESRERQEAALLLDHSMRDEFAMGLTRLQSGQRAAAVSVFERLANRREGIRPAHKHTFTDFAVNLRKSRLPAVAFKFYQRALELAPGDSNAYFNMARIMFDLGDYDGTEKHLQQALNLDIEFVEARQFLEFLTRHRLTKTTSPARR